MKFDTGCPRPLQPAGNVQQEESSLRTMDADAGVALTETDKEKSIDEAKPAEPLPDMGFIHKRPDMGFSPDMDETGAGCAERRPSSFSNYLSSSRDLREPRRRAPLRIPRQRNSASKLIGCIL